MKKLMLFATACAALTVGVRVPLASGPIGIYGIVEKVVFEPNEQAPERIQVWGVFSLAPNATGSPRMEDYQPAQRGYLYFTLPSVSRASIGVDAKRLTDTALKEWADLKAVAGTGQAVGFGSGWTAQRVRPATETPANPSEYILNVGIVKLSETGSNAAVVKALKAAAARK
jgi:hypothetical protein